MDAVTAFSKFIARALDPARAMRYSLLAGNAKGRRKVLSMLGHDFEKHIRSNVKRVAVDRAAPCYAYGDSIGFGAEFGSVAEAYRKLSSGDSWLIVVADGSAGIYRPEANWSAEIEISA